VTVRLKRRNGRASVGSIRDIVPGATAEHDDWIEFLRRNDGAVPEVNEFDVGTDSGSGVQTFFGVADVQETRRRLSDRMPEYLLPIADAEGGNYVWLGLSPGGSGVQFWDHETEEATQVSSSFAEFLEDLRPFDPDFVELKPGQVVSAWIDPALLEAEKKKGGLT
jgi:hypothetical protein